MTMQEHAPAPHMKGVVWEYFRGGNRDGPGHYAGGSSASRSGPAGAGFCPAWAKPGGFGARLGRGRRGRSRPGRAERLGRGSRTGRGQGLGGAGRVLASGRVLVPVSGACPERWRRWSGARVGPGSGARVGVPAPSAGGAGQGLASRCLPPVRGLACRVTLPRPAPWPASVRMAWVEVEGGRRTMTRQRPPKGGGSRCAWSCPCPMATSPGGMPCRRMPGRGRGAGCPRWGGWVGDGARRGTPARWGSPTICVHPMGGVLWALESRSTEGVRSRARVRQRAGEGACGARVARGRR